MGMYLWHGQTPSTHSTQDWQWLVSWPNSRRLYGPTWANFETIISIKMPTPWTSQTTAKQWQHCMNESPTPQQHSQPYTDNHWKSYLNNQPHDCRPGLKEAMHNSTSSSKQPKNKPSYGPPISATSSELKLSKMMTFNHHEKPCYTAPVWAFFVHNSLREITLKMLSFL